MGFPDSSVGKESAWDARAPGSTPGLGRSAEEGTGHPHQYSWASLAAQLVKNLPAMQETWVRSLAWEDPLEKGTATHSSILAWRIPWIVSVHGVAKSQTWLNDFHFHFLSLSAHCLRIWSYDVSTGMWRLSHLFVTTTVCLQGGCPFSWNSKMTRTWEAEMQLIYSL